MVATHGDAAARKELETRLAAVLDSGGSRAAKDYVCRKLMMIGTAESVPALAALLPDKDLSHMARYALERIPGPGSGPGAARRPAEARRDAEGGRDRLAGRPPRRGQRAGPGRACWPTPTRRLPPRRPAPWATSARPRPPRPCGGRQDRGRRGQAGRGRRCLACAEQLLADGKKAEATPCTSR